MKYFVLAVLVVGLVNMNAGYANEGVESGPTRIATLNGNPAVSCSVFVDAPEMYELVWDGACLNGAVDGLGTLSFSNPSLRRKNTYPNNIRRNWNPLKTLRNLMFFIFGCLIFRKTKDFSLI